MEGNQLVARDGIAVPGLKGRGRRGMLIALIAVLVVAAGAGGAVFANASLTGKYSPGQAALDYFAAQQRGDADEMMAHARFLHDQASAFFDKTAVTAMLRTRDNSDLKDVKVLSIHGVDANTSHVSVSMIWAGTSRTATYTVRRDKSQTHYVFYNSWRVDVPSTTINLSLPNQPGLVTVDGIIASSKSVETISGYHTVKMAGTSIYDADSKFANGVDGNPTVTLDGIISASAMTAAALAIKDTLNNHCDSTKYFECPGHTYTAPNDGRTWYLKDMPGYPEIDYKTYVFNFTTDPTPGMNLVVTSVAGQVTANGTCATTLTVNGSQTYEFKGTWTATLTSSGSSFSQTNVKFDCAAEKA